MRTVQDVVKTRTRTSKTQRRPVRTEAIVPVRKHKQELGLSPTRPKQDSCVAVYLASLGSDKSRVSIYDALKRVIRNLDFRMGEQLVKVEEFPWEMIRYRHMQAIRSKLTNSCSPSTANHTLSAVRGVLGVAWNQHKITTDDYQRAKSVKGIKGSRVKAGRHIESDEITKLFAVCGDGVSGARDSAVLSMLYGCGMRRAEVAEAMVGMLDMEKTNPSLRLIGKGNKERLIFLPPGTVKAMRRWLELRGNAPGRIFLALTRYGVIKEKGISDEAIRMIVERIELVAKVKHLSPHDFRRTFIGDLLEAGADIVTVQNIAGHSSPTTTSRYDRRGDKTKKRAAAMLTVPYIEPSKASSSSKASRHE